VFASYGAARRVQEPVLEVNGIPGWQALQSVGDQDLTKLVVSA
jgi:hypothetical protein